MTNILLITSDQHHYSCLGSDQPRDLHPGARPAGHGGDALRPRLHPQSGLHPGPVEHHHRALSQSPHGGLDDRGQAARRTCPPWGSSSPRPATPPPWWARPTSSPWPRRPESPSLEAQPTAARPGLLAGVPRPLVRLRPRGGLPQPRRRVARRAALRRLAGGAGALQLAGHFQPWPPDPDRIRRRHAWDLPEGLHYNVWIAERTIALIEQAHAQEQPFFLWASFPDPHPPYLVPQPWASMYRPEDMQPGTLIPGEHEANPPHFGLTQQQRPDFSPWASRTPTTASSPTSTRTRRCAGTWPSTTAWSASWTSRSGAS